MAQNEGTSLYIINENQKEMQFMVGVRRRDSEACIVGAAPEARRDQPACLHAHLPRQESPSGRNLLQVKPAFRYSSLLSTSRASFALEQITIIAEIRASSRYPDNAI